MTRALVHRIRMRMPSGLRRVVASAPLLGSAVRRIDPLCDPRYVWTLKEPLMGARFKVAEPSERQYVTGPYEPAVVRAIRAVVRPGMACVDAGAHIGYMTLIMARAVGSEGRVFAFEPSVTNCERLRENLALNSIETAVIVQAFVSDTNGRAHLADWPTSFEHRLDPVEGISIPSEGGLGTTVSVALDSYFAETTVDFVKLDVEGADKLAIDGMRRILAADRPAVLIEDHGEPTVAAKAVLSSFGYRFKEIDRAHTLAVPGV